MRYYQLTEAVNDNYLYHATEIGNVVDIIRSDSLLDATSHWRSSLGLPSGKSNYIGGVD